MGCSTNYFIGCITASNIWGCRGGTSILGATHMKADRELSQPGVRPLVRTLRIHHGSEPALQPP